MTFSLENAFVYDIETFPNCFILSADALKANTPSTWEISVYRDDRQALFQWFQWLYQTQAPMIGFNNEGFDYPVIHALFNNPQMTVEQIYAKAQAIITGKDRFAHTIWPRDRFAPQVDLFKVHHFDNKAKTTSLKALQFNMRCQSIVESSVPFGTYLTAEQIANDTRPYCESDVAKTKRFAHISRKALDFRCGLVPQFGVEVMNFNDTKIGLKILEQRLGDEVCYDRSSGRKQPRQTVRHRIAVNDIIFPYVKFYHPELNRVLDYLRGQVLLPADIELIGNEAPTIKTKGVFTGLHADVGGITFHYGTGGIHGSVAAQRVIADDEWLIRDIDVKALYPSIAIVNRMYPLHLGAGFVDVYAQLPIERDKHLKGTVENASFKLGSNGFYGNTNNKYSWAFDPQYTLQTTINGQLMLSMLAEWLIGVPTLNIIQINTDGITYRVHRDHEPKAAQICRNWEQYTMLKLEDANYSRMFIRDVNNYIAEDKKGKLKQKGAYWHPTPGEGYEDSISEASPPAWHKDLGGILPIRAAVAAMVHGINPETFIRVHSDPYDLCMRARADSQSHFLLDGVRMQRTMRYYVANQGGTLIKHSPPTGEPGSYKRRSGLTDEYYAQVAATVPPGQWDARIHTKNQSKHEQREMQIEAGWKIADCSDMNAFRFDNVNYDWYLSETRKLII